MPHAGEAVAEVVPSHADRTSRHVDELVAEVRAGGYVARRAARGAGFDHCFRRSRGGVGLCEASPPKSNILFKKYMKIKQINSKLLKSFKNQNVNAMYEKI